MSHKVLVVDDEDAIVLSLEFLLKRAGYEVEVARDGEEALTKVSSFCPDLILLDVMMPRKDGYEVCQTIRANAEGPQPKIAMLTAKGRDVERAKGLAVGADDYITKPFATQELLSRVRLLLGETAA